MNALKRLNEIFAVIIVALVISTAGIVAMSYFNIGQSSDQSIQSHSLNTDAESQDQQPAIIERGDNGLVQSTPYVELRADITEYSHLPAFQINGMGTHDMVDPVMIVNFFATWCPKCKAENPLLLKLSREHGIPIYGVNIAPQEEVREAFFKEHENPFKMIGIDDFNLMYTALPNIQIPSTMIITNDLKIHWQHGGEIFSSTIENEILPVIERLR